MDSPGGHKHYAASGWSRGWELGSPRPRKYSAPDRTGSDVLLSPPNAYKHLAQDGARGGWILGVTRTCDSVARGPVGNRVLGNGPAYKHFAPDEPGELWCWVSTLTVSKSLAPAAALGVAA